MVAVGDNDCTSPASKVASIRPPRSLASEMMRLISADSGLTYCHKTVCRNHVSKNRC